MKLANEVKVGILALVGLVILIVGYNFLKGKNIFATQNTYYAVYNRIDQLKTSNPVLLNGLQVGIVESIKPQLDGKGLLTGKIIVAYQIDKHLPLPLKTKAQVLSISMLGDMGVKLHLPEDGNGGRLAQNGDTLVSYFKLPIFEQGEALISKVDSIMSPRIPKIMEALDTTFQVLKHSAESGKLEEAIKGLAQSMTEVKNMMGDLSGVLATANDFAKAETPKLSRILDDAELMAQDSKLMLADLKSTLRDNKEKLNSIIENADGLTGKLNSDLGQVDVPALVDSLQASLNSLNSIVADIESGEGATKMLLGDDMNGEVENIINQVNGLLAAFKENPKDFVGISLISIDKQAKADRKRDKAIKRALRKGNPVPPELLKEVED